METIYVLIVDDHQIVIDGIRAVLDKAERIEIAGYANTGREAVTLAQSLNPQVIIMDVDMPGMNGLAAVEEIVKVQPLAKVIMLSLHLEAAVIRQAINNGAKGYLPKNVSAEELVKAIHEVADGGSWFSADVTMSLSGNLTSNRFSSTKKDSDTELLATLSERETEVLKGIAEGFSSKEIAAALFISARTVDTHRTNIMRKLDTNKVAGLIRFALRNGLVE